jgi:hypothetical protein
VSTMYQILETAMEVRERRNWLRRPSHREPELLGNVTCFVMTGPARPSAIHIDNRPTP